MKLRSFSLALVMVVLGSAIACDSFARKGGRSGGSGGWSGKGQASHGKGHGGHKHGHKHHHRHIFLGAGFYNPWYAWDPWWYTPLYPYHYPFAAPAGFEQTYIEQYAVPLESGFWYYCHSAGVYYPGVAQCAEGWEQVAPRSPAAEQ
jgi:hypothetical protein